jgi:hypothetical protein
MPTLGGPDPVFLVPLTPIGIRELMGELLGIIDEREDDVRIYPLPARVEVEQYGRQGLPEGIDLVGGRPGGETIAALAAQGRRSRSSRSRR